MLEGMRLRSRCRQLLRDLDVQPPLDVTELCIRLGAYRGRPIRLVSLSLAGSLGYSLAHGERDVIVFHKDTSRPHQDHIICHELGHLIMGHLDPDSSLYWETALGGGVEAAAEAADVAAINLQLPFDGVPRRLRRICFDSLHERAVEQIANVFMEWAVVPGRAAGPAPEGLGDAQPLFSSLLLSRRGWL